MMLWIRSFGMDIRTLIYLCVICSAVSLDRNDDIIDDAVVGGGSFQNEIRKIPQPNVLDGNQIHTEFCEGMYMTMFMDGFHWTMMLPRGHPSTQCLNYFVSSWKLQNPSQFHGALLFSFLLALILEGLSVARMVCIRYFVEMELDRQNRTSDLRLNAFLQHVCLTIIYGLLAVLGYLLMFIVMSYSIELVAVVILGLIVGNRLWTPHADDDEDTYSRPSIPPSAEKRLAARNGEHPARHTSLLPASMHAGTIRKRNC